MKKEELTELEIAKIQTHNSKMESLQQKMQQMQVEMQKHQQKLNEVLDQIKERTGLDKDFPTDKLNFNAINWGELEGEIIILEEEDKNQEED